MILLKKLRDVLGRAAESLGVEAGRAPAFALEPAREAAQGEVTTNLALVLASATGRSAQEIAQRIKERLERIDWIASVETPEPGFINLRLHPSAWQGELKRFLAETVLLPGHSYTGKEDYRGDFFSAAYAYARCVSVLRAAAREMPEIDLAPAALAAQELEGLEAPEELDLLRRLAFYPGGAESQETHKIAVFLNELASAFHRCWFARKEAAILRFILTNDPAATRKRLALVQGVRIVTANGLSLLGLRAQEEL